MEKEYDFTNAEQGKFLNEEKCPNCGSIEILNSMSNGVLKNKCNKCSHEWFD